MKVTLVARHDGGLFSGGAEVQVLETARALEDLGIKTSILGPLTSELGDIVHFIGPYNYFSGTAALCRTRNVPYVASPVWFDPISDVKLRVKRMRKRLLNPESINPYERLLRAARCILVPSTTVQRKLSAFYRISMSQVRVVPNGGVDPRFASGDADSFRRHYDLEGPFVLHVGNFLPRKNQLNLIRALKPLNMRLVCIGKPVDQAYFDACKAAATQDTLFIKDIDHENPLLPAAYAAADVVAIPSLLEDFLLAGMEAGAAGARLVLSSNWGAQELYENYAVYPDGRSPEAIRTSVQRALSKDHAREAQQEFFLNTYSWKSLACTLRSVYEEAVGGG
jgi:glycosyltransferase involved in cell wall biosynthesis